MKKFSLLAAVSTVALVASGSAQAADMALKALPTAAPVYSWTGCYVGGHVGFGWARHEVTASNFSLGPGSTAISRTNAIESNGGVYGGQVGCDYQFANVWVVGVQGDVAGTNLTGNVGDPFDRFLAGNPPGTIGVKTDMIASLTARLGVTALDNRALFYVKGGAAWDRSRWDFTNSSYCKFYGGCTNNGPTDNRAGWTAGGGVEWVLSQAWPNWTAFAEYDFYGFDRNGGSFPVALTAQDPRNALSLAHQQFQAVKIGLNFKLRP